RPPTAARARAPRRAYVPPAPSPGVSRASGAGPRRRDERSPSPSIGQIGVIDVGSNTARFVVFEASRAGAVRAVYEAKEVPRLGLRTGPDGRLTDEAIQRGVAALKRFAKIVRQREVPRTLAVATSAVRDAPNGPEFLRAVERSSGLLLRTISGAEEARYGYLGIAGAWELHDDVVCDLGGGSLQLVEVVRGGPALGGQPAPRGPPAQPAVLRARPAQEAGDGGVARPRPRRVEGGVRRVLGEDPGPLRGRRNGPRPRPGRDRLPRLADRPRPRLPALRLRRRGAR
ncbi:exopolyphosphatase, partial [mine drainage metagenome]